MAQTPTTTPSVTPTPHSAITTEEAFVADRQMFWSSFTGFTTGAVIVVVVLLVLMRLFLV